MVNANLVASAVAIFAVIGAVVTIALTLSSAKAADGSSILNVPAAYTAFFSVVWTNGVGDGAPNGWTTTGTVSVVGAAMDFTVTSAKEGRGENVVTFTGGQLFHGKTCVDPIKTSYEIPNFSAADAAASATLTSDPTGELGACAAGALYGIHAFDADHVFCAEAGQLKWFAGQSYKATITSFAAAASAIAAPADADMTACTGSRRLMAGDGHRRMEMSARAPDAAAWFHAEAKATHARNLVINKDKHVCWIHGMGTEPTAGGDANGVNHMGNGAEYWENIQHQLDLNLNKIHAIKIDTRSRGWNNNAAYLKSTTVQDVTYSFIQYYKCDVVFAHSMGNTVLGALAGRGNDKLGKNRKVRWYLSQGPMRGSSAARMTQTMCNSVGFNAAAYTASFLSFIGNAKACSTVSAGYCAGTCGTWGCSCTGRQSVTTLAAGFKWGFPTSTCSGTACPFVNGFSGQFDATTDNAFASLILGRLCGTSAWGSGGFNGAALSVIQHFSNFASASDGMVEMITCAPGSDPWGSTFGTKSTNVLYKGGMNHADGTGMNGDSAFGSRQPVSWFHNMITRGSVGICPIAGNCATPGATWNAPGGTDAVAQSYCTTATFCSDYIDTRYWGSIICGMRSTVACHAFRCVEYADSCAWNRCWGACCGDCVRTWWYSW